MNLKNLLRSTLIVLLIGSFYFGKVFSNGEGKIIYVNQAAEGKKDGTNWENAFVDLQLALANASSGDEIWVATGLYLPSQINDQVASFSLQDGVAIYGGFQGAESSRNERNWKQFETILSGDLGFADPTTKDNDVIDPNEPARADNSFHVVQSLNNDHTAVLDGFTISGGNAGSGSDSKGGGIYMQSSDSQIKNLVLKQNAVLGSGAAIYINRGSPSIDSVLITKNVALEDGGGIYSIFGYPHIIHTTIHANEARNGGGGAFNNSSSDFEDVVFSENVAAGNGGGIYYYYSETQNLLRDVTFEKNQARNGGGVFNHDSKPRLNRSAFIQNEATSDGGAMFNLGSTLAVQNSTFSDNKAGGRGGAIFNSDFCEDDVPPFGCVNYDETSLSLSFVTIASNEAVNDGGGIFTDPGQDDDNETRVKSVLIMGNTTISGKGADCRHTIKSYGYNFVNITDDCTISSEENDGTNLSPSTPVSLLPLAKNGGKVSSHAVPDNSPTIDLIPAEHCTTVGGADISLDVRESRRPYNEGCDIGAFEWPVGRAYLPNIMLDACEFCETEPNGEAASADSPLITGNIYFGKFPNSQDLRDYYYFEIPSTHRVSVWLTNVGNGHDYDLFLADKDLAEEGRSATVEDGGDEEIVGLTLEAGRYYIFVTNPLKTESDQFYHLTLIYK